MVDDIVKWLSDNGKWLLPPVTHLEAIRILLSFVSYKGFKLYQIDMKVCS
jgi:hypothetical protein